MSKELIWEEALTKIQKAYGDTAKNLLRSLAQMAEESNAGFAKTTISYLKDNDDEPYPDALWIPEIVFQVRRLETGDEK